MNAFRRLRVGLLLMAPLSWAGLVHAASDSFASIWGGYLVSVDFTVNSATQVISPPSAARPGDLLFIRPRLNNDEYLVLQKCLDPACSRARVVRAWNAAGYMGPDTVSSNKVPVEAGATYLLWMQRIPTQGGAAFSLYRRSSAPLVFTPAGPQRLFDGVDFTSIQARGPVSVSQAAPDGASFVAKFDGGSVVRMQLLRAAASP